MCAYFCKNWVTVSRCGVNAGREEFRWENGKRNQVQQKRDIHKR